MGIRAEIAVVAGVCLVAGAGVLLAAGARKAVKGTTWALTPTGGDLNRRLGDGDGFGADADADAEDEEEEGGDGGGGSGRRGGFGFGGDHRGLLNSA